MTYQTLIRNYKNEDKGNVLALFRLNVPTYFSPEEEKGLIYYLDHEIEKYFVLEVKNKIIGCGGINFAENKAIGKISWDFMHPDYHGQGFGTMLLKHRLDILKEMKGLNKIMVRTSQLAYQFYEKSGFEVVEKIKDYWAKGFDLYTMEYRRM
jgi:ribosomal-protein-alanine N-acetyltransferase